MAHAACRMQRGACRVSHAVWRMPRAACRVAHAACRHATATTDAPPKPKFNALFLKRCLCQMHAPTTFQRYFQQIRPPSECEAGDGRVVGHLLMDLVETKPKDSASAIRRFVGRTALLRCSGFPNIGEMLGAMVVGRMVGTSNETETTSGVSERLGGESPARMSEQEARTIGSTFGSFAERRLTAAAAVNAYVYNFPALIEMSQRHAWFEPMLQIMALRIDAAQPAAPERRRRSSQKRTSRLEGLRRPSAASAGNWSSVVAPEPAISAQRLQHVVDNMGDSKVLLAQVAYPSHSMFEDAVPVRTLQAPDRSPTKRLSNSPRRHSR